MSEPHIFAEYDPEARALYVELEPGEVARTVEAPGFLAVDLDADGRPLALEALEVPVTRDQIDALASRFRFEDAADEVWTAVSRAQPGARTRSGLACTSCSASRTRPGSALIRWTADSPQIGTFSDDQSP